MGLETKVLSSIIVLIGVICLAAGLRKWGIIKEEHGPVFSGLVTRVTLPSLIFVSLANHHLNWSQGLLAVIMIAAELACLFLAWVIGRGMKLERPQLGAMILVSGFGTSSLLGYALISEIFPHQVQPLTEAVIISELGVGPLLFTVGVMIAMYFGSGHTDPKDRWTAALGFFRSPIFISVVAGLLCAAIGLPKDNRIIETIFQALRIPAASNTLVVALTVGVLLKFEDLRAVLKIGSVVCLIKLILKPILVVLPTWGMGLGALEIQVLVLEAAMPSALLTVVLSHRYGCDGQLASRLVFATTVVSAFTLLTMFNLLT